FKVHDRSTPHAHSGGNEERMVTRKQKAEGKSIESEREQSPKKSKVEDDENGKELEKSTEAVKADFENFCKATKERLSIKQMREILEANGQDSSGSDDAVVLRCQDVLFYGPLDRCPICGGMLELGSSTYSCKGVYSEWSSCTYTSRDPPRRNEPIKLPDSFETSGLEDLLKNRQHARPRHHNVELRSPEKPFKGMVISLAGRLSRTHQYWKTKIEKHGGKVANHVIGGVNCLVVSPAERERGGSSKLVEAMERSIPVVREAWLTDSIEKKEPQLLDSYDIVSDISVGGRGIPLFHQDSSEEALETIAAELKIYGKRAVHLDTKLRDVNGQILEKDGILYNCAFACSDRARGINDFCVIQLIKVPPDGLYFYHKKGKIGGDITKYYERLEERENVDDTIKEFAKTFEESTGNEFEPWEREKKIQKKLQKFYPIDLDDGFEVRYGALGLRKLGSAAAHCKLDPKVANLMKILCSQEIYRYAMMEMGLDFPELPLGIVTDIHLKRCEEILLESVEKLLLNNETGMKGEAMWSDFSQRIFTLLPSTRPYVLRDFNDVAEHGASAFETIRDINVASRLIGDMSGSTLDDPLFECYKKLCCSLSPVEKESSDYGMIAKYLEKTYEPVKVGEISYRVAIDNVFAVESSACPSHDEIKKLPNKVLLWCGTRSSNLLRHLQKGFLPAVCFLPVPGYMFGKAIVCSDAAAEAARYGFTAVDRPEGFLVLAVASLGESVIELSHPPEDPKQLEEKKQAVIGRGKKKTDESEHFTWTDDIKVPCGKIIPSNYKDSSLEYNEYAVYNPQQVCIKFLVAVKLEEMGVEHDAGE
ncbi:hypothetical protein M569_00904, partial [Genlisea aurea]